MEHKIREGASLHQEEQLQMIMKSGLEADGSFLTWLFSFKILFFNFNDVFIRVEKENLRHFHGQF